MNPAPVQSQAGTGRVVPIGRGTHVVVAIVVQWRGRVGLFRRSSAVAHDQGLWHCITGYVEVDCGPAQQALTELYEETGLGVADLESFHEGGTLTLGEEHGDTWTVHTFSAATHRRRLVLNEEHDAYKWVDPRAVARFSNTVDWLGAVLDAAGVLGVTARQK